MATPAPAPATPAAVPKSTEATPAAANLKADAPAPAAKAPAVEQSSELRPRPRQSELTSRDGKRSLFTPVSVGEYIGRAPWVFIGIGLTIGSLAYGMVSLLKGDMVGQARGMSGRIGFQILTIGGIVGALTYRQNEKEQEKIALQERRAARKAAADEERKKQQEEVAAHKATKIAKLAE